MLRIVITFYLLFGLLLAADKKDFLKHLHKQQPLSYHSLSKHYFEPSPLDPKCNEMEESFRVLNGDLNHTAIDFTLLDEKNIIKLTKKYAVVFINVDDFYKYALLTDKNGTVQSALLLAFHLGMCDWQVERYTTLKPEKNTLFMVTDEFRDSEWIVEQVKGDMIINYRQRYLINVDQNGSFHIRPTTTKALFDKEDKRLNRLYKSLMKMLHKKERKILQRIQRKWLSYTKDKCNTILTNETKLNKISVHIQEKKMQCRYEETKRRTNELDKMVEYFSCMR